MRKKHDNYIDTFRISFSFIDHTQKSPVSFESSKQKKSAIFQQVQNLRVCQISGDSSSSN
jgi:hypothetical protein